MDPIYFVFLLGAMVLVAILSYLDKVIEKNKTERYSLRIQKQIDEAVNSNDINSLIQYLKYSNTEVSLGITYDVKIEQRKKIVDGFRKIGLPAVESLIAILQDPASPERGEAARLLGEIGDRQAVLPLIQIVRNTKAPDQTNLRAYLRESAIIALGIIGDPKAADPLFEVASNDPNSNERVIAGSALFELGDPRAFDILMNLLQIGSVHLTSSSRAYGLSALGKTQDSKTIPLLIDHLSLSNLVSDLGVDEFKDEVRSAAAVALAGMGEPAFKALIAVINNPESGTCEYACYALSEMKDLRALPHLERLISETKNRSIRSAAKHAVSAIEKNQKQA